MKTNLAAFVSRRAKSRVSTGVAAAPIEPLPAAPRIQGRWYDGAVPLVALPMAVTLLVLATVLLVQGFDYLDGGLLEAAQMSGLAVAQADSDLGWYVAALFAGVVALSVRSASIEAAPSHGDVARLEGSVLALTALIAALGFPPLMLAIIGHVVEGDPVRSALWSLAIVILLAFLVDVYARQRIPVGVLNLHHDHLVQTRKELARRLEKVERRRGRTAASIQAVEVKLTRRPWPSTLWRLVALIVILSVASTLSLRVGFHGAGVALIVILVLSVPMAIVAVIFARSRGWSRYVLIGTTGAGLVGVGLLYIVTVSPQGEAVSALVTYSVAVAAVVFIPVIGLRAVANDHAVRVLRLKLELTEERIECIRAYVAALRLHGFQIA